MRTNYILILILFIMSTCLIGQEKVQKNYFPVWTFHQKNANIHGVSVGIASMLRADSSRTNTNGIKIELIGLGILCPLIPQSPVVKDDSSYLEMQREPVSEKINGLSLSVSGSLCDCITNGLSIGAIGQINRQVNGMAVSYFMNFSQKFNGLQMAIINDVYYLNGCQIGIFNHGEKTKGMQVGIKNSGNENSGLQIGAVNESKKLVGVQVGFWNVNQKRKLPLLNWNFRKKQVSQA
jgi:hypothetical protein